MILGLMKPVAGATGRVATGGLGTGRAGGVGPGLGGGGALGALAQAARLAASAAANAMRACLAGKEREKSRANIGASDCLPAASKSTLIAWRASFKRLSGRQERPDEQGFS